MKIYSGGVSWRGDEYVNITVDIEVLNELKDVLEDLIVDYARVKNFDGINEAIASREELVEAIEAICPQPIVEEQTDEEAHNRNLHGCLYGRLLFML